MKDYSTVVESALKKLKDKNYESWSMIVKLCFDSPIRKVFKEDQVSMTKTDVNPVELMKFHPFFNQLNYQTVKYFLTETNLCKLAANTLLYARQHESSSVFIILFGTIIIHHDTLGALGVLTMENTVGEESQTKGLKKKLDAAYSQSECYLLEYDASKWTTIKEILISMG